MTRKITHVFYTQNKFFDTHQVQASLIGNPVRFGSGPAAVNGDEILSIATVFGWEGLGK